mgnify:CR=1 FL=1
MLTFRKHKDNITIAQIKDGKDKKDIYIKRTYDNKAKPEIDTTDEEKEEIFNEYLENLTNPITKKEHNLLLQHYKDNNDDLDNAKLYKILTKGIDFVNTSLKRYLNFKEQIVFPYLDRKYWCIYVTGMSGSGDRKSTRLNSSHVSESRMPSSA